MLWSNSDIIIIEKQYGKAFVGSFPARAFVVYERSDAMCPAPLSVPALTPAVLTCATDNTAPNMRRYIAASMTATVLPAPVLFFFSSGTSM